MVDAVRHRIMDVSDELIFHYCSAESLLAILKHRTLRFGDAGCMNDGEEVVWALAQFDIAMQRLHDRDDVPDDIPAIPKKFLERFRSHWEIRPQELRHFLASFSMDGDSLSQWRAYADDAQGFSIGFCVSQIDIPARFAKVEYDSEVQQNEIINMLVAIFRESKLDQNYFDEQGESDLAFMFGIASAYKNPAFVDEREVRGSHSVALELASSSRKSFKFIGGFVGKREVEEGKIEYRVGKGRLIPFIDFPFQLGEYSPVKEIWLGPRCATSESDMEIFLETMGYGDVEIKRAGGKYR
ncbi:MAG TPA: DUF2971 domain-containing protein [Allosphingosinicella sp.]